MHAPGALTLATCALVSMFSLARASTPMPGHCPPDQAVYEAVLVAPNSQPDDCVSASIPLPSLLLSLSPSSGGSKSL
jgi:hypothetical protein